MKLIIDIPEREYKVICENNYVAVCACPNLLSNAIKDGTPIPDNVEKYIKCFECAKAIQGAPIGNMCGKWECDFEKIDK